jgi:hypothetical protein
MPHPQPGRRIDCRSLGIWVLALSMAAVSVADLRAQSVCLPLPRLLTLVPAGAQKPGGQGATTVEVKVSGELLDGWEAGGEAVAPQLLFSHPGITATPILSGEGKPEKDRFLVTIAADVPPGLHDARMMTALGVSSPRVFTIGTHPEALRTEPNTTPAQAFPLAPGMVCNAQATAQAADYYRLELQKGQRVVVDCAARGIESKLRPVLILADATGADLVAERRGGLLDFTAPATATYLVKLHDLSFQGGPECFYRLLTHDLPAGAPLPERQAAVAPVLAFSWPPPGLPAKPTTEEIEGADPKAAQQVMLPLDLGGRFFPAADVDSFEFDATAGEVWWIEVASERIGAPTNPAVVVQRRLPAGPDGAPGSFEDVAELADIPAPIKPSTNHYAYDGPPYEAGSADCLGRLEIKETGTHRLQIRDLFGGTRDEPLAFYRLVVRKARPDFALVCWPLHMELRNGDRAALSKPLALRSGGSVCLEVAAIRRDGFDGPIELAVTGLPEGVSATGLRIPAGATRGQILVTAAESLPRNLASIAISGRGTADGAPIERPCRLAGQCWPIRDGWAEIPFPRLLADTTLSTGGSEPSPLTLRTTGAGVSAAAPLEAVEGTAIDLPLELIKRADVQGATFQMRVIGPGFDQIPGFEFDVAAPKPLAIDLAKLKIPPGDHAFALVTSAVTKYVPVVAGQATPPAPTDIAEILVSTPIHVRVTPAAKEATP